MKRIISCFKLGFLSLIFLPAGCAQNTTGVHVKDADFDHRLSRLLKFDVPVISVDSFYQNKNDFIILDTRTPEEYSISHIRYARFMNYNEPDFSILRDVPKDQPVVLYCSVGYRSEKIGRELMSMGYSEVFNLYGSIFEWVNEGHTIFKPGNASTDSLHTYNRRWSRYVNHPDIIKIW